jgi:dUTP pyrophosphatase
MKIKLLNDKAIIPTRATNGSVGYDLYSTIGFTLFPEQSILIPIGIAMEIPRGLAGIISHRSGQHLRKMVSAYGVIDNDYVGEIMVCLINHSYGNQFVVKEGDRIAQIVFHQVTYPDMEVVENLGDTTRGEGGFGSTGV